MSGFASIEAVILHGGPLDGERRMVRKTDRLRSFTEELHGTGPLGFPLITMHDYAPDEDGVWRYVPPSPPSPLDDDPHGFFGRAA